MVAPKSPPLLVIGLDAGDPNLMLQWAAEGHMPALASILKRGCHGKTGGPELLSEHGVWLPLFSGISRGTLGFYYFRQLKPGTYELEQVTGFEIQAAPFWKRLKENNLFIMDVPEIFPVPGLRGIQLFNWAPHFGWKSNHPAFQILSEPSDAVKKIEDQFGSPIPLLENSNSTQKEDENIYNVLKQRIDQKGKICRHVMTTQSMDVAVVVFTESHLAGHQFWKYRNNQHSLTNAIRDVYEQIDREIESLMQVMPPSTNTMVVSSVGMEDFYPNLQLTEAFTRQLGYQATPDAARFTFHPMAMARKLLPQKWRIGMSRFLSRDTRERLLSDQFRDSTDWSKTKAFSVPVLFNGLIRINLKDREPVGTVAPGAEYEHLLDQIEEDLQKLTDARTGEPAVSEIFRPGILYGASPPPVFPDLWVLYRPSTQLRDLTLHPKTELRQSAPEFFRDSDHSHVGFFAACGPSVAARGDVGEVSVLDLAPTFLYLTGQRPEEHMKGRPIAGFSNSQSGRGSY